MFTFAKDESGATAIEYGVIAGFVATLIVVCWTSAYEGFASAFNIINTAITLA